MEKSIDAFFVTSPAGMAVVDSELRFVRINPTLADSNGLSVEEHLGRTVREVLPKLAPIVEPNIRQVLATGKPVLNVEIAGEAPGQPGITRQWLESFFPIAGATGSPVDVGVIVMEVTDRNRAEEALQESEEGQRTLFESVPDPVVVVDADGRIVRVNQQAEVMFGYQRSELIGQAVEMLIPERFRDSHERHRAAYIGSPHVRPMGVALQLCGRRKDDSEFPVDIMLSPLAAKRGMMAIAVARDVTERKRAEDALKVFRALVDHSTDALEVIDPDTARFLDVSLRCCTDLGYSREELLSMTVFDVDPSVDSAQWAAEVETVRRDKSVIVFRNHRRKDGSTFPVEVNCTFVSLNRDYLVAAVRDITRRKQAEDQMRQLAARVLQAQDLERRRISLELHDSIGQLLCGLAMNLAAINETKTALSPEVRGALHKSLALTDQCAREVRTLSYLLHPPMLEEFGLVRAVRSYLKGVPPRSGIQVDFEVSPRFGRLPRDVETALFYVVQEALTNVHRHSGSPTAKVRLNQADGEVTLEVQDKGRGISSAIGTGAGDTSVTPGVGIAGMRERLKQFGGRLDITSSPTGTTLRATVPVDGGA
ncbi:MAG TPA: PAS domain S-box protein [Verrucomicrobiae bacterium]|nr:PAS domain S-box protein [Verrucomicrobiae bacterium]